VLLWEGGINITAFLYISLINQVNFFLPSDQAKHLSAMIPGLWMCRLIVFSVGAYLHTQGGTKAT